MADQNDQDDSKRIEDNKAQAYQMYEEMQAKGKQKIKFHQKNTNPKFYDEDELRRFDGSIKKNTAFVKKLRELTETKRSVLTKDFESLNLLKYIEEVAKSIAEAKLKLADVSCAVAISSLVHCRYSEFSHHLTDNLQRVYLASEEDDRGVASTKYRLGLRFIGELLLAGIIDHDIGISLMIDILTKAINSDQKSKTYSFVTVVTSFARQFAEDFAGIAPRNHKLLFSQYQLTPPQIKIIAEDKKSIFSGILSEYYESVKKHLIHEHKEMHKRARRNRQILQNKGELSTERLEGNEKAEKVYDKLLSNIKTLSDLLDMEMPDLPEDRTPQDVITGVSIDIQLPMGSSDAEFGASSLWEDEEQKSFYENITDIKPFIPAILYEGGKRKKTDSCSSDRSNETEPSGDHGDGVLEDSSKESVEQDEEKILEEMIKEAETLQIDDIEEEGQEEPFEASVSLPSDIQTGGSAPEPNQFDVFLSSLPNMMNKKIVDTHATEFCLNFNTKLNRQRLCRSLFNVDRNRMDLVSFYARFVCTITPMLPDISDSLVAMLTRDFRYQLRKKDQIHVHTKIKNARFIAELTKFGICAKIETMKCITLTLQDFTHHNIELACTFMEHCGRYLLLSPESYLRAKALLEIMMRKKSIQHLDGRQKSLIDDALFAANPPKTQAFERIRHPPLHEYILLQLYKDLNKLNTEKVLKQLRKIPWNEPEVFHLAVRSLTEAWNVKFNNVHCLANLLAGLRPYQEEATIRVVDGILEDIRLGLEINENRMNQRRISMIKYLGEMYNYQLIESNVVFRTLYTLLTFGCNPDGSPGPLDPHDSYFRARLVCVLLDTCGSYFDHGTAKKKLDTFFIFFQCYMFNKRQPLPLEIDHMVVDTLMSIQPNIVLYASVQDAIDAAADIEKKFRSKIIESGDDGGGGAEDSDDDDDQPLNGGHNEDGEEEEDDDDEEDEDNDDEDTATEGEEEDDTVLKPGPKLIECQEDDDFLAALDRMMNDSRKIDPNAKSVPVDIAIPLHLKGLQQTGDIQAAVPPQSLNSNSGQIKFTLMSKKGRKQELKDIEIPIDSKLASGLSDTQQLLRAEQQEMKKLVLTHERRQEEEEHQAMIESVRTRFERSSNIRSNQSGGRKPPGQTSSTTASNSQPRQYYNQANRRPHSQHKRQNDRRQPQ